MKTILLSCICFVCCLLLFACTNANPEMIQNAYDNQNDSKTSSFVRLEEDNTISEITVTENTVELAVGDIYQIEYSFLPDTADQDSIIFISDSESAAVDENGLVTAVSEGTAVITVSAENSEATADITVSSYIIPAESFSIKEDMIIGVGEYVKIPYTITPDNASIQSILWTSSDESVCSVDENGYITGNTEGTAELTGKTSDGTEISDKKNIKVTRGPFSPLSEITEPRYTCTDGVFQSETSDNSQEATLMFCGDIMALSAQQNAAHTEDTFNFNESFDMVRNIFSGADFVMGNLETITSHSYPYTYEQKTAYNNPVCNSPATILDALRYAGYDAVATANNHCSDAGRQGVIETNRMLDKYMIAHTGTFADSNEQRFILFDINGIKTAVLSYTELINNGWGYNSDEERNYMMNRWSEDKFKKDISDAKNAGAEFIVVFTHWGSEYQQKQNSEQEQHARIMADAGADLIIGSHSHCLQPAEIISASDGRNVPCIYSMSNFVSSMSQTMSNDTIILSVNIEKNQNGTTITDCGYIGAKVFPDFEGKKYLIVPVCSELNGGYENASLSEARQRINNVMGDAIREITQPEA